MSQHTIRVVGLHKLPFDAERFAEDLQAIGGESDDELRAQSRENWDNAWLVVVEFDGPADALDFGQFDFGETPLAPNNQAAWSEVVLSTSATVTRAAFYLHYVREGVPLWYGPTRLMLPPPSPAPAEVIEAAPYESPD